MALYELRCPSLEYVYSMTWAEFMIRLYAWKRSEERNLFKVREIAWSSIIGPNMNPKKVPRTKEKFWPMKKKKKIQATELMLKRISEVTAKYHEEVRLKNG